MSFQSHATHGTFTSGKSRQYERIADWFNPNRRKRAGYRYTLVGAPTELRRHIRENQAEGFSAETLVIVERDPATYDGLVEEANRLRFRGEICLGDFADVITSQHRGGRTIAHLDFDGVGNFNSYGAAERVFSVLHQTNAESYAFTWYPRSRALDPQTRRLCNALGMAERVYKTSAGKIQGYTPSCPSHGRLRFRMKELAEVFAHYALPSWTHHEAIGYRGCESETKVGGCSMQWIMGKRWTPLTAPFTDHLL